MQASKVMPDVVYAIKGPDGCYARFKVDAINTRRFRATGSPHDYKSTVEGTVVESGQKLTVEPNEILGPFEEYAELAERKKREDAERARQGAERAQALQELWRMLYERSGQPCPNDPGAYRQPFRIDSGGTIRIDSDGVRMLTAALKQET